jgi:hypothetical protein
VIETGDWEPDNSFVAFVDAIDKSHRTTRCGNNAPAGMDRGPRGPHESCATFRKQRVDMIITRSIFRKKIAKKVFVANLFFSCSANTPHAGGLPPASIARSARYTGTLQLRAAPPRVARCVLRALRAIDWPPVPGLSAPV